MLSTRGDLEQACEKLVKAGKSGRRRVSQNTSVTLSDGHEQDTELA
jgi:hypothetical protein